MDKSSFFRRALVGHKRVVTLAIAAWLLAGYFCAAQTPVVLAPLPQLQFFDQTGTPLAFGCVFTYQSGTSTPVTTFTDSTGTTENANPVILSGGGSANIWLIAGQAYSFRVKSAGGSNCSSGSTLYTVNGIGGGTSQLVITIPFSSTPTFSLAAQNELFLFTLTGDATSEPFSAAGGILVPAIVSWQITQDGTGAHSFSWPANTVGGCTVGSQPNQTTMQMFLWNGTDAIAVGPCVIGDGPEIDVGTIHASTFAAACAHPASVGRFQLCNADAMNWRNAANSADEGLTIDANDRAVLSAAAGLELSGANPNMYFGGTTSSFPFLKRNGTALNLRLADDSGDTDLTLGMLSPSKHITSTASDYFAQGPEVSTPGSAPASGQQQDYFKAGKGLCALDHSSNEYCMVPNSGSVVGVQASSITQLGSDQSIAANTVTVFMTKSVTMPSSGCPCRAFVSYGTYLNAGASGIDVVWVDDGTNGFATSQVLVTGSASQYGTSGSSFSPGTYANGATITFSNKVVGSNSGGFTVKQNNNDGEPQETWMNVAIFTSN